MTTQSELRLYCLMREDIEIPRGKFGGQTGHAFLGVYQQASPELREAYFAEGAQPKIVLAAKNLHAIERAAKECADAGINFYIVTDAGRTVFPEPTVTCVGIGPVTYDGLPKYIQKLRLCP